jgi:hypothetical protein
MGSPQTLTSRKSGNPPGKYATWQRWFQFPTADFDCLETNPRGMNYCIPQEPKELGRIVGQRRICYKRSLCEVPRSSSRFDFIS